MWKINIDVVATIVGIEWIKKNEDSIIFFSLCGTFFIRNAEQGFSVFYYLHFYYKSQNMTNISLHSKIKNGEKYVLISMSRKQASYRMVFPFFRCAQIHSASTIETILLANKKTDGNFDIVIYLHLHLKFAFFFLFSLVPSCNGWRYIFFFSTLSFYLQLNRELSGNRKFANSWMDVA